ncbi:MAG: PAS domain S-box protein, partial [Balneolaceae bacterium]
MAIKEKYQALFENSITALFITRPDGTILEANRAACRMFGYSEVEFRKLGRQGVIDPNSPGLSDKLKEREETGSTTGEMIGIRKTGEKFWCEFSSSVFDDPAGGKMASMVLIDMFDAKDRQESLKGVMNNVPGVIYRYVTKSEGFEKTQFVSGEVKQVLGFNPDEIFEDASLGWKNIHEDDAERVVHSMKQAADKNTKWICEYRYHHPDGTVRWLRGMGNPVSNKNGRVVWDSIVIDITAEKRAEARKNEDEEELTLIFDTISDAIFTLSVESNETYRFLRVNNQFLKNVGKPQNQVIGKKLEDVIAPENISFVKEKYSEAIATGKNLRWEESIQIKNGTKTGIVSVTPLLDEESNCYQLVGSISDISERKAAENELTRVLDQSLDVICTIDSEGKFVKVSEASSKIWGYEPEELEGKAYIDLVHPEDIEKSNKVAEDIMSGVDVTNFENRYRRKDGSVVPNVWSARWHKDDKLMYCVAKDATERIKAEELVTGERKRYEKLFRKMPAFVSMMEGPEHRNIMANPVFCQVTGRSEDDLIGITAKEAFPELVDQGFIEILDNVYKTGEPFEIKEMEVYVEISKGQGPVRRFYDFVYLPNRGVDGKIEGILAFGMDVTHQVENRENLKISNERFKYVLEASEDVIYEHDMVADTITLSENFQQIFGYSIADEPFTLEKWVTLLHPDDEERINSRLEKVLSDSNENKWEAEFRYAKKDGNYAFVLENSYIIRDNSGNAVRMIGSVKDITDQKVREIQKSLAADVSLSFNQADGLSEAISKTLNHIVDLKNFELAEFWIADRDTKQLQLIADHYATGVSGQFKSASGETASFKKGEGLPGSAWKKKEPLFWRNLDKRKSFIRNELAKTTGLKTGFAYPVLDGDDVTGVLVLAVKEDLKTEPYYLPIFSELAVQLASEIKRKQLEVELSRIFDSAPDGIIVSGFDGYLKKVNPAFTEILGYSEEELLSTPFMEFVHPKDREITLQAYENENSGLGKSYFINRYVKKSGKIVWISWSIKVFPEEEVAYSVAKDITDQKELEDLLKQANRLAKIGSWEVDLINNEVYWSDITREIHEAGPGFEPDLETRVNYYKEGESRDKIREALNRAIQYGEQWDLELELITAKGNDRWVRAIGEVEMVNGKPVRIYGSLQGIHQRKIADLKLQERTRHINVIASLNSALLNYENWYEALETHLDEIGEAVQSDRVYYFENRFDPETGEGFASQKLEWCR